MNVQLTKTHTLFITLFLYALQGLSVSILGVVWPDVRHTFGMPLEAIGTLITVSMVSHLLASFNNGRFLNRFSMGKMLFTGTLTTTLGLWGMALAPNWPTLILASFITGWGAGLLNPSLNTIAAEDKRPKSMHWLHAAFGIGASTGPLIITWLMSMGLSWRTGYWLIGGIFALTAVLFLATISQWQSTIKNTFAQAANPETAVTLRQTLTRPIVWLSMLFFFLYTGMEVTVGQWSYSLFTEARNITPVQAGLWVSAFYGSITVGRIVLGWLNLAHASWKIYASLLGVIVGAGLLWLNWGWTGEAAVVIIGLCASAIFPMIMAGTSQRVGETFTTHAIGLQVATASIGASVVPGLAGLAAGKWGLEIIGLFVMVTAVLLLLVHQKTEHTYSTPKRIYHTVKQTKKHAI
ncbi:MAG: hypothetical protein Kow0080_16950 [Candidatus Promineifilaceae bacterium]